MGRSIDQDVHAAFVEFRAKEDDKCLSVQCIYCQQIRAKNTSRQKQHLLECPGLQNHSSTQQQQQQPPPPPPPPPQQQQQPPPQQQRPPSSGENGLAATTGYGPPPTLTTQNGGINSAPIPNSNSINNTPTPAFATRPPLPPQPNGTPTPVPRPTPKPKTPKLPTSTSHPGSSIVVGSASANGGGGAGSNLPAPPLDDVHAAFVEFRAKEEDKCLSVQCIYCNQIRAKNTSRQRQHLLECPTYLNVMKDAIPANNLLHRFDEGDIARSISLPTPALELDFRMSIKFNPRISIGAGLFGQRNWFSYVGGQWAGRWGKGVVIPGGQDSQIVVKDLATRIEANYLIQTNDEAPAFITCRTKGWWTGPKELLERMLDPEYADTVAANSYKWRVNVELETGDERYANLNTSMWIGSGCKRGNEVIYDAYRIS